MIKLDNISKTIKNESILKNISLNLYDGKVYGFSGRNGSGKTMLFRAIAGLISLDKGEIYIDGKKLKKGTFPKDLGLLLENPSFLKDLSAKKNLEMIASVRKLIDEKRIDEILKKVGLFKDKDKAFSKFSLGMKQRLAIGQAIMENPKILLLDEPTNAIDEEGIKLLKNIIKEEKEKNTLVLLASHEKEILEELADEIFIMKDGMIVEKIINNNKN